MLRHRSEELGNTPKTRSLLFCMDDVCPLPGSVGRFTAVQLGREEGVELDFKVVKIYFLKIHLIFDKKT